MEYIRLFIFVEGNDDEEFFKRIIQPKLEERYASVRIIKYAEKKQDEIAKYLKGILGMNAEYIYVADINNSPCITDKKEKIYNKVVGSSKERIIVVRKEIESWYLAGLDLENSRRLGIYYEHRTDDVNKEKFNSSISKRRYKSKRIYESRISVMQEILKHFSIEEAKNRNNSFRYFYNKYLS